MLLLCLQLSSCYSLTCDEVKKQRIYPEHGSFRIDTLYVDVSVHSEVMQSKKNGRILYHGDMLIEPSIGDSIYKEKGKPEYVLVTKDSTYIQMWSCKYDAPIIVDKWKNGDRK